MNTDRVNGQLKLDGGEFNKGLISRNIREISRLVKYNFPWPDQIYLPLKLNLRKFTLKTSKGWKMMDFLGRGCSSLVAGVFAVSFTDCFFLNLPTHLGFQ